MRKFVSTLPVLALLAACGGGAGAGPQTVSGSGVIVAPGAPGQAPTAAAMPELLQSVTAVTYKTIGGHQQMVETYVRDITTNAVTRTDFYTAAQSTPVNNAVQVGYDPRSAIFDITIRQENIVLDTRFQDPAHRTAFGGVQEPQLGVPVVPGLNYLENGTADSLSSERRSFFYQTPGASTRYVTLAGFIRNRKEIDSNEPIVRIIRTHGTEVFGTATPLDALPKTGTATFSGNMLASMISNTDIDSIAGVRTRFEWISGTAAVNVNFGAGSVGTNFTGQVLTTSDVFASGNVPFFTPAVPFGPINGPNGGRAFTARGTASFDRTGQNFIGRIDAATLGGQTLTIAGSSIDGSFYGPNATEIGGAFRIVGGIPDQRVNIDAAYTGK